MSKNINHIYSRLQEKQQSGQKQLAVLIDPDSLGNEAQLLQLVKLCNDGGADMIW